MTLHNPTKRFDYGYLAAAAHAALCVSIVAGEGLRLRKTSDLREFNLLSVLDAIQLLAGLSSFLSCLGLPRRPSLVFNGRAVDGQYTVSAFRRYTFAWAEEVLKLARSNRPLDIETIPKLHLRARSIYLEGHFRGMKKEKEHLLKTLLLAHAPALIFQTLFAIGSSILQFAPQLVMFALLKLLEQRADIPGFTRAAWVLVLALGLAILASAWTESWTFWMFISRLGIPVRSELSAMVFSKAMRRKDVKAVRTQKEQISEGASHLPADTVEASLPMKSASLDASEEGLQKSRQGTINLVVSPPFYGNELTTNILCREWTHSASQTSLCSRFFSLRQ